MDSIAVTPSKHHHHHYRHANSATTAQSSDHLSASATANQYIVAIRAKNESSRLNAARELLQFVILKLRDYITRIYILVMSIVNYVKRVTHLLMNFSPNSTFETIRVLYTN